jgi:hypothetical protein
MLQHSTIKKNERNEWLKLVRALCYSIAHEKEQQREKRARAKGRMKKTSERNRLKNWLEELAEQLSIKLNEFTHPLNSINLPFRHTAQKKHMEIR